METNIRLQKEKYENIDKASDTFKCFARFYTSFFFHLFKPAANKIVENNCEIIIDDYLNDTELYRTYCMLFNPTTLTRRVWKVDDINKILKRPLTISMFHYISKDSTDPIEQIKIAADFMKYQSSNSSQQRHHETLLISWILAPITGLPVYISPNLWQNSYTCIMGSIKRTMYNVLFQLDIDT